MKPIHRSATQTYVASFNTETLCLFVRQTGEICLDILKAEWSPIWSLSSVCLAIVALMSHPAPDSPLNCDAGMIVFG